MRVIDNRKIPRWYIGCTPDEPYETWELSDLRTQPYTYLGVPLEKRPTYAQVLFVSDDAGCNFGTHGVGITISTDGADTGRMDYVRPDGLKNAGVAETNWGIQTANVTVPIYPNWAYICAINPPSADPGYAVPGLGKVWYWRDNDGND